MALDGGDPRLSNKGEGIHSMQQAEMRKLHDPNVTFEEYMYYAQLSLRACSRKANPTKLLLPPSIPHQAETTPVPTRKKSLVRHPTVPA